MKDEVKCSRADEEGENSPRGGLRYEVCVINEYLER